MDTKQERVEYIAGALFDTIIEFLPNAKLEKKKQKVFITDEEKCFTILIRVFDLRLINIEVTIGLYHDFKSFKISKFTDQQIIEYAKKYFVNETKVIYEVARDKQIKDQFEKTLKETLETNSLSKFALNESLRFQTFYPFAIIRQMFVAIEKIPLNTFKSNPLKTEFNFQITCIAKPERQILRNRIFFCVECKVLFRELGDIEFKFSLNEISKNEQRFKWRNADDKETTIETSEFILLRNFFEDFTYFNPSLIEQVIFDGLNSFIKTLDTKMTIEEIV